MNLLKHYISIVFKIKKQSKNVRNKNEIQIIYFSVYLIKHGFLIKQTYAVLFLSWRLSLYIYSESKKIIVYILALF